MLSIFDYADLFELTSLAGVNDRFRDLIATHYMLPVYQVDRKAIRFVATSSPSVDSDAITFNSAKTIVQFVRHFGHLITKLKFSTTRFTAAATLTIDAHIAEHCAQTLHELDLVDPTAVLLNDTGATFERVHTLTIASFKPWQSLAIHRIYPAMRKLTFTASTHVPPLNRHFLPLTDLALSVDYDDPTQVLEILRLNGQLRAFSLTKVVSMAFLMQVSRLLANLEVLAIGFNLYGKRHLEARPIHFATVREFTLTVTGTASNIPERPLVTFGRLQHMRIDAMRITDVPMDLFERSETLQSLALPQTQWASTFVDLFGVVERMPALEQLTIFWTSRMHGDHVRRLIGAASALKRITFIAWNAGVSDDLAANMPAGWHLLHVQSERVSTLLYRITFERDSTGSDGPWASLVY